MRCSSALRLSAECFSSLLLLCGVGLITFGWYLLYRWQTDDVTAGKPLPGYVIMMLALGSGTALANLLTYCGACSGSKCLISSAIMSSSVLLFLEIVLAGILLFDPKLIDSDICPEGDEECIAKLDKLFQHPEKHAGLVVASAVGIQVCSLASMLMVRYCSHCGEDLPDDLDGLGDGASQSRGGLRRTLLEEHEWEQERERFEERSRKKVKEQREALSEVAIKGLKGSGRAKPSQSWDSAA